MKLFYVGIYKKLQKEYVNCRTFLYVDGQEHYIYIQLHKIEYIFTAT